MTDFYEAALDIVSSHSGHGNSYWSVAANCGHQRNLIDRIGKDPSTAAPDWARRGSYYHLLHQWWQSGKLPDAQVLELDKDDKCWAEACTLFSWYTETYPKDIWGTCIATELQLPPVSEQERVAAHFNVPSEKCPTGRLDMLTEMSTDQCERAMSLFGILLPGPGKYIVDYKHGARHNFDDEKKYTLMEQPLMYLTLDRIINKDPVKGMIFNKVSMTTEKGALKLKETSFRNYLACWQPDFMDRCTNMVQVAYQSMVRDEKNGYACGSCPFFQKECRGF